MKTKWTKQRVTFSILAVCLLASLVWNAVQVYQSDKMQKELHSGIEVTMRYHVGEFPLVSMTDELLSQFDFLNNTQDLTLLVDGLYASGASYSAAGSAAALDREWSRQGMSSYNVGAFYSNLARFLGGCRHQLEEDALSGEDAGNLRKAVDDVLLIRSWMMRKVEQGDYSFYGIEEFRAEFGGKLQSDEARFWFGDDILKKP